MFYINKLNDYIKMLERRKKKRKGEKERRNERRQKIKLFKYLKIINNK